VIQAVIIAAAVVSLALCWRNRHRGARSTWIEAFRIKMKIIFLVLVVCSLCSKAVVHTYRHFNPPPPPIIGP
jgi:TRAP-type C4-dicarboxylate transport system permease small subunit